VKSFILSSILCATSALLACTHALKIDNLPDTSFTSAPPPKQSALVIGVVNHGSPDTEGYVEAVAQALQLHAAVGRVIYPHAKGAEVDALIQISVNPEYRGAGTNFLVNWPGFLAFAPAWNGYKYRANPRTKVEIAAPDGQTLDTLSWEYDYVFHQADMGRTWTELGWLEWGVTPLIGGFVFMQYDTDQTPHFIEEASASYGRQVAAQIAQRLAIVSSKRPAPASP